MEWFAVLTMQQTLYLLPPGTKQQLTSSAWGVFEGCSTRWEIWKKLSEQLDPRVLDGSVMLFTVEPNRLEPETVRPPQ
jgi:hypothetical protein